jgi:hypothetical protein
VGFAVLPGGLEIVGRIAGVGSEGGELLSGNIVPVICSSAVSARTDCATWAVARAGMVSKIASRMQPDRAIFLEPKFITLVSGPHYIEI